MMPLALRLTVAAAASGVLTALGVWAFKEGVALATFAAHGWRGPTWADLGLPLVVLVPALGGAAIGWGLRRAGVPEEPGHGVTEVIEAVRLRWHDLRVRHTPAKTAGAAAALGVGASLGPEDPAVGLGGGVAEAVRRRSALPPAWGRALVAGGASAGVAAAFHAPLAALAFAVEVLGLRPADRAMAVVAAVVVVAYGTTALLPPEPALAVPALGPTTVALLAFAVPLGAAAGLAGALQIRAMHALERAVLAWKAPRWAKLGTGGLVLGAVGAVLPELLGIGYATMQTLLAGDLPAALHLAALAAGKLALMAVSFGFGFPGGFFAPSLFAGAAGGALLGVGVAALVPQAALPPAALALTGMAALLAAMVHAPLTAVLLLVAVSADLALAPALLVGAVVARWTARRVEPDSLYTYAFAHPARPAGSG